MTLTLPCPVVNSQSPSLSPVTFDTVEYLLPLHWASGIPCLSSFSPALPVILLPVLDQISQCRGASAVSLQTCTSSHSIFPFRGLRQSHSFKQLEVVTLIFIIFSLDLTVKFEIFFLPTYFIRTGCIIGI